MLDESLTIVAFFQIRITGTQPPASLPTEHRRAPRRNEDYRYVLHDILGYDEARIDEVTGNGAIGPITPVVP